MKRTPFGEPRPETGDEIDEALADNGQIGDDVTAHISQDEDHSPSGMGPSGVNMTGWSAEVRDVDGDELFTTNGFETRDELVAALNAAGITDIEDE